MPYGARTAQATPLHRLIKRREAEALLDAFHTLIPNVDLALVHPDGRLFAGLGLKPPDGKSANAGSAEWAWSELVEALHQTDEDRAVWAADRVAYPLRTQPPSGDLRPPSGDLRPPSGDPSTPPSAPLRAGLRAGLRPHWVGALVARHVDRGSPQEAILRTLHRSLTFLLAQALEKRAVAAEALERYREINLLYSISETIGARLDTAEILPLVLSEAFRVIQADAAAVLMPSAGEGGLGLGLKPPDGKPPDGKSPEGGDSHVRATSGESGHVEALVHISRKIIQGALDSGRPSIITELPVETTLCAVLCAPLKAQDRVIGAIVMGRLAGAPIFTASDEKLLMTLAGQAAIAIETARLHREEIERQRLEEELAVGRRIQLSLLPNECPDIPGWEFAAVYRAARQVGGDLYDFFDLPGDPRRLGMLIADVTGKGVAAALFMAVCRTAMRLQAVAGGHPSEVLKRANRFVAKDLRSTLLLSAFYATLDVASGELAYASGGHNWPLWLQAQTGECRELSARGLMLGAFEHFEFEEHRIEIAPGDLVVFYTDGVTEAMDANGQMFDEERLQAILLANRDGTAEDVAQAIVGAVRDFTGDTPPSDDLTLFVVRRVA